MRVIRRYYLKGGLLLILASSYNLVACIVFGLLFLDPFNNKGNGLVYIFNAVMIAYLTVSGLGLISSTIEFKGKGLTLFKISCILNILFGIPFVFGAILSFRAWRSSDNFWNRAIEAQELEEYGDLEEAFVIYKEIGDPNNALRLLNYFIERALRRGDIQFAIDLCEKNGLWERADYLKRYIGGNEAVSVGYLNVHGKWHSTSKGKYDIDLNQFRKKIEVGPIVEYVGRKKSPCPVCGRPSNSKYCPFCGWSRDEI